MPQTTAQKLGIMPDSTTLVLGGKLPGILGILGITGSVPTGASFVGESDVARPLVLLAADTVQNVRSQARAAFDQTEPGGRLWIAYRKGANRTVAPGDQLPLHRDTLQAALAEVGLDGVTLIALNDTWSAMRVKAV